MRELFTVTWALPFIITVLALYYAREAVFPGKRRLRVAWWTPVPLVSPVPGLSGRSVVVDIENKVLTQPYLTQIDLTFSGRHDVTTGHFDSGRPIAIDLGREVSLVITEPDSRITPLSQGTRIVIGPDLIRSGTHATIRVLTEDKPSPIEVEDHLIDTKVTSGKYKPPPAPVPGWFFTLALLSLLLLSGLWFYTTGQWSDESQKQFEEMARIADICLESLR